MLSPVPHMWQRRPESKACAAEQRNSGGDRECAAPPEPSVWIRGTRLVQIDPHTLRVSAGEMERSASKPLPSDLSLPKSVELGIFCLQLLPCRNRARVSCQLSFPRELGPVPAPHH